MSRKDYQKIAAVVAKLREFEPSAASWLAIELAVVFKEDNPNFDNQRWHEATKAAQRG